jgi:hypothetical protein
MNNLENEGCASYILDRSTPKPAETRQIPLNSPCAKCGEGTGKLGAGRQPRESSLHCANCKSFIRWVGAAELKRRFGKNLTKPLPADNGSLLKFNPKATLGAESDPQREIAESDATERVGGFEPSSEVGRRGKKVTYPLPADNGSLVKKLPNEGGES